MVEVVFWKGEDEDNLQSQSSWDRMQAVYKKLPQREDLNINLLVDWIPKKQPQRQVAGKKLVSISNALQLKIKLLGLMLLMN